MPPKKIWKIFTLGDQAVQVLVIRSLQTKVTAADIVDGLVVHHERAVRMLKGGVRGQDGVVRLNNGGGSLRGWVHTELQLALLAVINRQALHKEGAEARASSTAK